MLLGFTRQVGDVLPTNLLESREDEDWLNQSLDDEFFLELHKKLFLETSSSLPSNNAILVCFYWFATNLSSSAVVCN